MNNPTVTRVANCTPGYQLIVIGACCVGHTLCTEPRPHRPCEQLRGPARELVGHLLALGAAAEVSLGDGGGPRR